MKDELTTPARLTEPILVGEAKLPFKSDNCAVKTLFNAKLVLDVVKLTTIAEPEQKVPVIGKVVIVFPPATSKAIGESVVKPSESELLKGKTAKELASFMLLATKVGKEKQKESKAK